MIPTETDLDTVVRDSDPPAVYCPYCERPFDSDRSRALHIGEVHSTTWTDAEETAYEEAMDAESDDLWMYHMKVVIALGVTYLLVVLLYMIVLS